MGGRLTERERNKPSVQVIVSESPPPSGESLRSILDGGGFDIVGAASSPEELRQLLTRTDPQVVVFDAGTSVTTVAETRKMAPNAGLVVVWPAGVTASVADLKVEPWRAAFDLGKAVRAACVRHAPMPRPGFEMIAPAQPRPPQRREPVTPVLVPVSVAAFGEPVPDPVARRRANLAVVFAAASFVVLVLLLASLLAEKRITSTSGFALPHTESQSPGTIEAGDRGITLLSDNPAAVPTATAFLLTRSLSGGLPTGPSQTGAAPSAGGSHPNGIGGSGPSAPTHSGGPANNGSGGGGGPPANGGGQPVRNGPSAANQGNHNGNSGNPGHAGGGGANGGTSQGQSGQSHGQSGESHGQSGESHGQSGQSHGQKPN